MRPISTLAMSTFVVALLTTVGAARPSYGLTVTFVTEWGSFGTGDGQFNFAQDVGSDGSGNVYVADLSNNRVQKFDSNGNFIRISGRVSCGSNERVVTATRPMKKAVFASLRTIAMQFRGQINLRWRPGS